MSVTPTVVLVVDDDYAICDLLQDVLQDAGYAVESAHNGDEARARLVAGGIDLVLLDRALPDRDGLDLCRWVRTQPASARQHLPIILLSALEGATEVREGVSAGADAYLAKPFDVDELLVTVGRWATPAAPDTARGRI